MAVCDNDFGLMSAWFRGTDFKFPFPIKVAINNAGGGASWIGPTEYPPPDDYTVTVQINAMPNATADLARFLLVAEVTEMFMYSHHSGWQGAGGDEGSTGEGLSRFLQCQLLVERGLTDHFTGFDVVPFWLNSATRPNYVDNDPDDATPDVITGCTAAFIYYLHYQLGFDITAIIDAGAATMAGVYRKLTGRTDGWQTFIDLVNLHYPIGTAYQTTKDNIFPVPELSAMDDATVVSGAATTVTVNVNRINSVDVIVSMVSDRPELLTVADQFTIAAGDGVAFVPITAAAFVGPIQTVGLRASYAGKTLSASVYVHPRPSILLGLVADASTGLPISGAVVVIDDGAVTGGVHYQLLTLADGSFKTAAIRPNTYTLETTASGYVPQTQSVIVVEGEPDTDLYIALTAIQPFVVHGTITDDRAVGIAGATVTLAEADSPDQRISTVTDQRGSYTIANDPGQYVDDWLLTVTKPGYVDGSATFGIPNGANLEKDFTLVRTGSVTGLITDSSTPGKPVANAVVHAGTVTATADATGRYLMQLPPGSAALTVQATGFEVTSADITVVSGAVTTEDFALVEASATLAGVLLDAITERPIPRAHIVVEGAGTATTDADGAFTVSRIPVGRRQITEHAQGYPLGHDFVDFVAHQTQSVTFQLLNGPNPHPPD
jgi:protocatechuate 3,4-dioxygenase beta subunit